MAPMFSAAYGKGMNAWEQHCMMAINDGLWACDPISGESLQVSKTICADDVQETSITETVAGMNAAQTVSSQFFDHELECKGLGRNGDKEEHLLQFRGKGAVNKTRDARGQLAVTGRIVERARYLGNIIAADGSTRGNVDRRIAAAKQGSQALYGIWGKRRVDTGLIRELFKSMVQGRSCLAWKRQYPV